jgi:hypothetical protein
MTRRLPGFCAALLLAGVSCHAGDLRDPMRPAGAAGAAGAPAGLTF